MRGLLVAAALAAAAVGVHLTTPTEEEQLAPFVVAAEVGEWGQARTFGARVEGVALAEQVTAGDWTGTTDGVWVVVTATAETALRPATVTASLSVGGRRYDVSARPGLSALSASTLSPGLAQRGDLVFELPATALDDHPDDVRLRLGTQRDPRLDAVVDVPLDVRDLDPEPLVALAETARTTR